MRIAWPVVAMVVSLASIARAQEVRVAPPADPTHEPSVVTVVAPPAPLTEARPDAPAGGRHVWIPGYWRYAATHRWVWVRGHFQRAPRAGTQWTPPHWEILEAHRFRFVPGRWYSDGTAPAVTSPRHR